jgi:hypothetical protein
VIITFDKPMVTAAGINLGNWELRFNNLDYVPSWAAVAGNVVTLNVAGGIADPGIDRVNYDPPPPSLRTLENARDVVAFTDFPLTA